RGRRRRGRPRLAPAAHAPCRHAHARRSQAVLLRKDGSAPGQLGLLRGLWALSPVGDHSADLLPIPQARDEQSRVPELLIHDALPRLAVPPRHSRAWKGPGLMAAIYLIRHSQASFGSSDYDQLSEIGLQQARVLGASLALRRPRVRRAVCGTMRRHQQTAGGCLEAMSRPAEWEVDAGWDEYDH